MIELKGKSKGYMLGVTSIRVPASVTFEYDEYDKVLDIPVREDRHEYVWVMAEQGERLRERLALGGPIRAFAVEAGEEEEGEYELRLYYAAVVNCAVAPLELTEYIAEEQYSFPREMEVVGEYLDYDGKNKLRDSKSFSEWRGGERLMLETIRHNRIWAAFQRA